MGRVMSHSQVMLRSVSVILDPRNFIFHSLFLAHLDYGWSSHNNIFSRCITYLLNLLPNDEKGEESESLWFQETFCDE